MTNARTLFAAALLTLGTAAIAQAQTPPTSLGQFRDWAAYTYTGDSGKVCYAITQPTQILPEGRNRDPVFMFITNRPGEGVSGEVSIITGYQYLEGSRVEITIDSSTFVLFTQGDGAWVENPSEEQRLIGAMRAGTTATVEGTSRFGTVTTDTYSLFGISAALDKINQECPAP